MKQEQSSAPFMQPPAAHVIVASAIFLFFALLLFIALFSYNVADPAWSHNNGTVTHNVLGSLGAWYSDLSYSLIGKMSYLVPITLVVFCIHGWREKVIDKELFSWRLFMLLTAILSGCTLWAKHDPVAINTIAGTGGGAIGSWMIDGLEKSIQSVSVIMAFASVIFFVSISLLFNIPWGRIAIFLGANIRALFSNLVNDNISKKITEKAGISSMREKINNLNRYAKARQRDREDAREARALAEEAGIIDDFVDVSEDEEAPKRPIIGRGYQPEEIAMDDEPRFISEPQSAPQIARQAEPTRASGSRAEPNLFGNMSAQSSAPRQPIAAHAQPQTVVPGAQQPIQQTHQAPIESQQPVQQQQSIQQPVQTAPVQSQVTQHAAVEPQQASAPASPAPQRTTPQQPVTRGERPHQSVEDWLAGIDHIANRHARSVPKRQVSVDDLLKEAETLGSDLDGAVDALSDMPTNIPEAKPKRAVETESELSDVDFADIDDIDDDADEIISFTPSATPSATLSSSSRPLPASQELQELGVEVPEAIASHIPVANAQASEVATDNVETLDPVSEVVSEPIAEPMTTPVSTPVSAPVTTSAKTTTQAPIEPEIVKVEPQVSADPKGVSPETPVAGQVQSTETAPATQMAQVQAAQAAPELATPAYVSLDDDDGLTQTIINPRPQVVTQVVQPAQSAQVTQQAPVTQPVQNVPTSVQSAPAQPVQQQAVQQVQQAVAQVAQPVQPAQNVAQPVAQAVQAAQPPQQMAQPVTQPVTQPQQAVAPVTTPVEMADTTAPMIEPMATPVPMATERGRSQELPSINLLDTPPPLVDAYTEDTLADMARVLEATLNQFKISSTVMYVSPGPVITRFELELAPGIQAKKVTGLSQDLARALAVSRVRVEEVIPGSSYVGLEVPNKQRQTVYFRDIVGSKIFRASKSPLTISLGADTSGKPKVVDLMKMPHALVAGTTGSGKSVCINVMLLSMLYKATPKDLRLILVDPKMLEMSMYEDIPHLLTPVITDMNEAENALTWAVGEMERRYQLMAALKVRKIDAYNEQVEAAIARGEPIKDPLWQPDEQVGYTHHPSLERLPYIVIVIDELADMMMVVGKQVEQLIARLTQKARAAGIHVVLATQRPSTDVLTGLIKANVPTRIAFQVSSGTDSRVIIDSVGAEKLLGHGDMLYVPPGVSHPQRLHGAFVGDAETDRVTDYLRSLGKPDYVEGITGKQDPETLGAYGAQESDAKVEMDPLFEEAVEIVLQTGKASISSVQRHLRIGYNRAARMIEVMQAQGIVSEPVNGIRQVIGRK